jgi:hypothetical protein
MLNVDSVYFFMVNHYVVFECAQLFMYISLSQDHTRFIAAIK